MSLGWQSPVRCWVRSFAPAEFESLSINYFDPTMMIGDSEMQGINRLRHRTQARVVTSERFDGRVENGVLLLHPCMQYLENGIGIRPEAFRVPRYARDTVPVFCEV